MATSSPDVMSVVRMLGLRFVRNAPGAETVWRCPFGCDDDSRGSEGHFYINREEGTCYCQKCDWRGNLFTLRKELKRHDVELPSLERISPEPDLAPLDLRDKVYKVLLKVLPLEDEHKNDLLRRGLTEQAIREKGFKSVPQDPKLRWKITRWFTEKGVNLKGIPGFFTREGRYGPYWDFQSPRGYFIPVLDPGGKIQALKIRLDRGEPKYIWFSSHGLPNGASSGSPAHFTKGTGSMRWITEGPLKAEIAHALSGQPFVGVGGVNAWRSIPETLAGLGVHEAFVAFDADACTNPNVARAVAGLINALKEKGLAGKAVTWPRKILGHDAKGIDDAFLLLRQKKVSSITLVVDGVPVTFKYTVAVEIRIGGRAV